VPHQHSGPALAGRIGPSIIVEEGGGRRPWRVKKIEHPKTGLGPLAVCQLLVPDNFKQTFYR
jgi:hypothetical protein